jgi:cytochrome c551/c552
MKKLLLSVVSVMLFSVTYANAWNPINSESAAVDGALSFETNGCTMCHDENMEKMGPSLMTIRMSYGGDENALVSFFKGETPARVYPAKAAIMQPQLAKIQTLYENEIRALARHVLGIEKF